MFHIAYLAIVIGSGSGDLSAYWSFDSIDNDVAIELSSGLNATVVGATLTPGALNGGLYFDGIDDYASVDSIEGVQKSIGALTEGTISAWFRFDHSPSFMEIETIFYLGAEDDYSSYGTSAHAYELEIGHFSAQKRLYWTLLSTEDGQTDIPLCWSTVQQLNTSRWYHILCTVSEDEGTHVYLDNIEIFDSSLAWNFGDETMCKFLNDVLVQEVLWFGKGLWNNEEQLYEGAIDEVRIWNRAINSSEVDEEYERVASVINLQINPDIPDEMIVAGEFNLIGSYENIVELSWRLNDGEFNISEVTSLDTKWSLSFQESMIPAGRHNLKVRGRNAARRSHSESRIIIQPDMNADGSVNIHDLLMLITAWGDCECHEDLTGDGKVNVADILLLINAWR